MAKLKGHKPGCKCVGCSPETRRRGMASLGLKKLRRKQQRRTHKAARDAAKRYNPRHKAGVDHTAARELFLYIENDSQLYHSQYIPILKNLAKKIAKGVYNKALAVKLFMYLADAGAKKYTKEFGSEHDYIFSKATRYFVAAQMARQFMDKWRSKEFAKDIMSVGKGAKINPWARVTYKKRTTRLWREKPTGQWGRSPKRKIRSNPVSAREVTIYARFLPFKIYAVKGSTSMYAGERFQHQFKAGGRVTGLPDGSIRLYPAPGKRLWSMIPQRG